MTDEQVAHTCLAVATIAAPIYAQYMTMPMKLHEAMRLAVRDAVALSGAVREFMEESL